MPEYRVIEWNEYNTNLSFCRFADEAYTQGKWAFVSDVVRLMVVYEYGGIYMDTDVELFGSFDQLMQNDAFFFFQNHQEINTGMGFGATKGNALVKCMLDMYCHLDGFDVQDLRAVSCPVFNTRAIKQFYPKFLANGETQQHEGVFIVSAQDYWKIACHYGDFSWMSVEQRKALQFAKKTHRETKFKKILRSSRVFALMDKLKLQKLKIIYTFLVFDFIEYGVFYWIVKVWQKLSAKLFGRR